MKSSCRIACLCCLSVFMHTTIHAAVTQREDGCAIMEVHQAGAEGEELSWELDLKWPGTYVVQLIVDLEAARGAHAGSVRLDGKPLKGELNKAYIIEEGLVSEFAAPVTFQQSGNHSLAVQSNLDLKKVRLVPQIYANSRIHTSSERYYEPWLKMHRSPEKVAAMAWYKQARFGMFIHWGVYSEAAGSWKGVPIEKGQGPKVAEWIMFAFQIPRDEYRAFAGDFNPDPSFATHIAGLAKETGMKYVVITAKHHDGFGLFDSAHSDFDVADATDYRGDLIKELYDACRAEGLDFGIYYSHGKDWSEGCDSLYAETKAYNDPFGVHTRPNGINLWDPSPNRYLDYLENKAYPQIAELIRLMPDLRLIWFDGEGLITEAQAFRFYKMIYDLNPNIIVNRRVGYDFGDYIDAGDNRTPAADELPTKHFETCGTANRSWGFKAHDHAWKSSNQLLRHLVDIVSKGGNYLLNIGPDGKGRVPRPCVESFQDVGEWVKTNADAIFGTARWMIFSEGVAPRPRRLHDDVASTNKEFWFSAKDDKVYAMSLAPAGDTVRILSLSSAAGKVVQVRLLGSGLKLAWAQTGDALEIDFSGVPTGRNGYAVEVTLN